MQCSAIWKLMNSFRTLPHCLKAYVDRMNVLLYVYPHVIVRVMIVSIWEWETMLQSRTRHTMNHRKRSRRLQRIKLSIEYATSFVFPCLMTEADFLQKCNIQACKVPRSECSQRLSELEALNAPGKCQQRCWLSISLRSGPVQIVQNPVFNA